MASSPRRVLPGGLASVGGPVEAQGRRRLLPEPGAGRTAGRLRQVGTPPAGVGRVHFGMGQETIGKLSVRWPDGTKEEIDSVKANQWITIHEGKGVVSSRSLETGEL